MVKKIKNLTVIGVVKDKLNCNHDVVVELEDGKKYVATFFTLLNISFLMAYYKHKSGECNNGSFFWASNMCIIEVFEQSLIENAVNTMISDSYFEKVFDPIS